LYTFGFSARGVGGWEETAGCRGAGSEPRSMSEGGGPQGSNARLEMGKVAGWVRSRKNQEPSSSGAKALAGARASAPGSAGSAAGPRWLRAALPWLRPQRPRRRCAGARGGARRRLRPRRCPREQWARPVV
jgi:hypothetical protein